MDRLKELIHDFWVWAELPEDQWDKTDLFYVTPDPDWFPRMGDVCSECIKKVNHALLPDEIDAFLFGMAINAEDEDILDYCKAFADESFIRMIVSRGVIFPQSEARWQLAELLRKDIEGQLDYLSILQNDPNEYVRRRAQNVIEDICRSK